MRSPRLPPLDTSGYISCPIDTPLYDFDQKSPLPCIIVTPSSPTEYHIAFHHKSSPLKHASFSALQEQQQQQQQQQQQPRARRTFLAALSPFIATPPAAATAFDIEPARRLPLKPRTRTVLVLAIPIFIIACHILASSLFRGAGIRSSIFGATIPRGGFSSAAAHMRAQRDAAPPQPLPVPQPAHQPREPLPLELQLD